ncbi:MAG: type IV secretory system conjugative DNA transfer family protein, partial [Neisseriaceae bacterium]|nr:type IV secretory system conjugative DNA transfer family protein [Neisseriaceae bacterium]
SFSAPLAIFNDPIVEAATSDNDFDFRDLRKQKMSIYVAIQPNDLDRFAVLTNLFFSQLINENIKQGLPEQNKKLKYQTLLLIDEFTLLGYMSVFQKGVSFIAGYNLRLLLIFQNRSQVEGVYKGTGANTFFSNFAVQTMFACKDHKEATEYADLVGSFTMRTKSIGRSSSKGGGSRSTNISEQKRHLINPDEFKTLPFEKCVVTMIGKRPIKADKIMYYKDPAFKDKVNLPPTTAPDLIVKAPSKRVVEFPNFSLDDEEQAKIEVEKNIEKCSTPHKEWIFNRVLPEKGMPESEDNIPVLETLALFKRFIGDKKTLAFAGKFME